MSTSRVTVGWPALIAGGIGLIAAGGGIAYIAVRPAPPITSAQSTAAGAVNLPRERYPQGQPPQPRPTSSLH